MEEYAASRGFATGRLAVRASIGTLAVLGLVRLRSSARPWTAYLLQYSPYGCLGGCLFCSQSLRSRSRLDMLSRVTWPAIAFEKLLAAWRRGVFRRVCLQTILKPFFHAEATLILEALRSVDEEIPVSVASTPVATRVLAEWRRLGVDYIGVGLDVATPDAFRRIGKPYTWERYMDFIARSVSVYGRGRLYVHLIAGLGEKPLQLVKTMEKLHSMGARVALFNYTRVPGTAAVFPGVRVSDYRLLQLARALIEEGFDPWDYIEATDDEGLRLYECPPVSPWRVFLTSGCPACNRPFYNESPRGPLYNYPNVSLLRRDKHLLLSQLRAVSRRQLWGCLERWLSKLSS